MPLETMEKDFDSNGETITVRFTKMPCTVAASWLMRATAVLARAGVKVSKGEGEMALQLPGLQDDIAEDLLNKLLLHCEILKTFQDTGKVVPLKMTSVNIDNSGMSLVCLMEVRKEALDFNFGFFSAGENSISAWAKQKFASLNIETSSLLSES